MTFEAFQEYVKDHILIGWKEDATVEIQKIYKNNNVEYTPIYIHTEDQIAVPSVYLEDFYVKYMNGISLDHILEAIRYSYEQSLKLIPAVDWNSFNFDYVSDRIVFRLVNYEKNQEILEDCPYIRLGDLAVTFRWIAYSDDTGVSSALVQNREVRDWKISMEDLLLAAQKNTPRIFPPKIMRIDDMIESMTEEEIIPEFMVEGDTIPMYILTNTHGLNGATCILYEGVVDRFAREKNCGVYILPSSIHEVIMIPEDQVDDPRFLKVIVKDANETVVELGDILSDSVYYYDLQEEKMITMEF